MPRQFLVQPDTELTAIFTPNSEEPIVCGRARAYERWSHPSSECARPAAAPERDGRGEVEAGQRLDDTQPGHLECRFDAAGLTDGEFRGGWPNSDRSISGISA